MPAVALHGRVARRVDKVDGDGVRVDHVVGGEQGSDLLVAGYHRVLAHVGAEGQESRYDIQSGEFCYCLLLTIVRHSLVSS